ncbi:MAG: DNA-binding protein [Saonia sp.]
MPTSIITTDDLREFKIELLEEIEELLAKFNTKPEPISWLRSADVKRKLKISTTTLQKLRNKEILKGHKIEGIFFYDAAEIDRMLLENEVQNEARRA